jgi:hypothetical protein
MFHLTSDNPSDLNISYSSYRSDRFQTTLNVAHNLNLHLGRAISMSYALNTDDALRRYLVPGLITSDIVAQRGEGYASRVDAERLDAEARRSGMWPLPNERHTERNVRELAKPYSMRFTSRTGDFHALTGDTYTTGSKHTNAIPTYIDMKSDRSLPPETKVEVGALMRNSTEGPEVVDVSVSNSFTPLVRAGNTDENVFGLDERQPRRVLSNQVILHGKSPFPGDITDQRHYGSSTFQSKQRAAYFSRYPDMSIDEQNAVLKLLKGRIGRLHGSRIPVLPVKSPEFDTVERAISAESVTIHASNETQSKGITIISLRINFYSKDKKNLEMLRYGKYTLGTGITMFIPCDVSVQLGEDDVLGLGTIAYTVVPHGLGTSASGVFSSLWMGRTYAESVGDQPVDLSSGLGVNESAKAVSVDVPYGRPILVHPDRGGFVSVAEDPEFKVGARRAITDAYTGLPFFPNGNVQFDITGAFVLEGDHLVYKHDRRVEGGRTINFRARNKSRTVIHAPYLDHFISRLTDAKEHEKVMSVVAEILASAHFDKLLVAVSGEGKLSDAWKKLNDSNLALPQATSEYQLRTHFVQKYKDYLLTTIRYCMSFGVWEDHNRYLIGSEVPAAGRKYSASDAIIIDAKIVQNLYPLVAHVRTRFDPSSDGRTPSSDTLKLLHGTQETSNVHQIQMLIPVSSNPKYHQLNALDSDTVKFFREAITALVKRNMLNRTDYVASLLGQYAQSDPTSYTDLSKKGAIMGYLQIKPSRVTDDDRIHSHIILTAELGALCLDPLILGLHRVWTASRVPPDRRTLFLYQPHFALAMFQGRNARGVGMPLVLVSTNPRASRIIPSRGRNITKSQVVITRGMPTPGAR